jgi:hypothetical protein
LRAKSFFKISVWRESDGAKLSGQENTVVQCSRYRAQGLHVEGAPKPNQKEGEGTEKASRLACE